MVKANGKMIKVRFNASFEVLVYVPEGISEEDAIADIEIPETVGCKYRPDTFTVSDVEQLGIKE